MALSLCRNACHGCLPEKIGFPMLGRMVDALGKIALGTLLRGNRTKSWIFYRHRFISYRRVEPRKPGAASMCGYIELATALTGSFLWILRTRGYHVWIHGASHAPRPLTPVPLGKHPLCDLVHTKFSFSITCRTHETVTVAMMSAAFHN